MSLFGDLLGDVAGLGADDMRARVRTDFSSIMTSPSATSSPDVTVPKVLRGGVTVERTGQTSTIGTTSYAQVIVPAGTPIWGYYASDNPDPSSWYKLIGPLSVATPFWMFELALGPASPLPTAAPPSPAPATPSSSDSSWIWWALAGVSGAVALRRRFDKGGRR